MLLSCVIHAIFEKQKLLLIVVFHIDRKKMFFAGNSRSDCIAILNAFRVSLSLDCTESDRPGWRFSPL